MIIIGDININITVERDWRSCIAIVFVLSVDRSLYNQGVYRFYEHNLLLFIAIKMSDIWLLLLLMYSRLVAHNIVPADANNNLRIGVR